ncbi:MAG: Dabb family protein [Fermentimonas sp.]|nr:Dabb family protein [Fermentimonas sp.]MDD4696081.1 Dabb family protein [Fermentimonas sp.]
MVKHIVLFKLASEAEGKSRAENALIIKEMLEALKDAIPVIRKIEVKINHSDSSADNHDIILESEFDSMEDVRTYAVHPEHLKVGAYITKVRTSRAAIDYEF